MSRIGSGDVIERQAGNNVYTVLVIVATICVALALIAVYMRADAVIGGLFGGAAK